MDVPKKPICYALLILLPFIASFIGSAFTTPSIPTWYASLNKPTFNPPNWIFAPVWTTLYLLMGISVSIVVRKKYSGECSIFKRLFSRKHDNVPILAFLLQLALNSIWSYLFFGLHNLVASLAEIMMLWVVIAANIVLFYRIDRSAGLMLVPYILWVSFAAFLNYSILVLNI